MTQKAPDEQSFHALATDAALWPFVLSIKAVQKRDGRIEAFQPEKMEQSLGRAFRQTGTADDFAMRAVAEAVLEQLATRFDGLVTPSTSHIRATIVATLTDRGFADVASAYMAHLPPVLPPPPMTPPPLSPPLSPSFSVAPPTTGGESHVPRRRRLNDERKAMTHKFQVGAHEGYLTVGLYDDGQPGEIFIRMSKEGNVMSGVLDAFATAISISLQYGVPLKVLVGKFALMRFEPSGATQNPNIPSARSIVDYVFRWLALKFLAPEDRQAIGATAGSGATSAADSARQPTLLGEKEGTCSICGALTSADAMGVCTHCGNV